MVKATQIGVFDSTAGWAIFKRCLRIPNHLVILLSRSERQSLELARKCKGLIDAYEGIQAGLYEGRQFQRTEKKQHEIEFPNGSRIIALAANPDTARGYTGDMVLDEFAFHQDAEAIYKSAYGRMTESGLPDARGLDAERGAGEVPRAGATDGSRWRLPAPASAGEARARELERALV